MQYKSCCKSVETWLLFGFVTPNRDWWMDKLICPSFHSSATYNESFPMSSTWCGVQQVLMLLFPCIPGSRIPRFLSIVDNSCRRHIIMPMCSWDHWNSSTASWRRTAALDLTDAVNLSFSGCSRKVLAWNLSEGSDWAELLAQQTTFHQGKQWVREIPSCRHHLANRGARLTYDVSEARLVLGWVGQKKRAALELRYRWFRQVMDLY